MSTKQPRGVRISDKQAHHLSMLHSEFSLKHLEYQKVLFDEIERIYNENDEEAAHALVGYRLDQNFPALIAHLHTKQLTSKT